MATTTNYGWTTPDDTALVKDGASAIRTLGSSVDTTTKALNPSTTLGDIEYRSSTANTNTRLGIGSTGQVLTVAGGVPSWASAASGLTLISTTTIGSAVSSVSLPANTFSSTYDNYKIIISLARSTASSSSGAINMRYRASGTDNSDAQYCYNGFESRETNLTNVQVTSSTSQRVGYYLDTLWSRTAIAIDLCGINIAKQTAIMISSVSMDGGTRVAHQLNGWHNVDAAYDSATFLIATGTLTNGRISVYGYQN